MQSLRARLLLSNLLIIGMIAIVMIGAVVTFYSLGQKFDSVLSRNFPSMLAAHRLQQGLQLSERSLELGSEHQYSEALASLDEAEKHLDNAVSVAKQSALLVEERDLAKAIEKNADGLTSSCRRVIQARSFDQASLSPIRNQINLISRQTESLFKLKQEEIIKAYGETQQAARGAFSRSVFITLCSILISGFLSYKIMQMALKPLAIIAKQARDLAGGNSPVKFEAGQSDEVGALADSLNEMAVNLSELRRSEVRRLRRAQLMSYAALESLHDPVIVTDAKARIINLNRAAEGLFGAVAESPRVPVAEHIQDQRIINSIRRVIENPQIQPTLEAEQTKLRVSGTQRTYLLRTAPMLDDENHVLGSVTVLEDVTYLKHLDQLKTEFIGVASHELKTPIASLLLNAQFLAEGGAGQLSETQKKLVDLQLVDLERLQKLSKDLLDLTKLEAGSTPPRFERVSPAELVRLAARDLTGASKDKGVEVRSNVADSLPMVRADRSQIGRVLVNLIANAIRHTPSGGNVTVSASPTEDDVVFRVQDTGEGIPEEFLPRIFERFVQVPGASTGGAGLGLAIVQNIVRQHGGTISVESTLGEGTTFTFSIPQSSLRDNSSSTTPDRP